MNPPDASNPQSSSGDNQESRLADVGRKAKEIATGTASQLKDKASAVAAQAKERAAEMAGDQKAGLAERLGKASSSVHESAKKFEEKDPNLAWFTHEAAARIQKVADYVRESDFRTLQSDAEHLVRRYPIACFGGIFLAGLVVGNLLKATADSSSRASAQSGKQRSGPVPSSTFPKESFAPPTESGSAGGSAISGAPPAETMS